MKDTNPNRRKILKRCGSLAAVGGLGVNNALAQTQSDSLDSPSESNSVTDKVDWEISETHWMDRSGTARNLKYAMSDKYAGDIKKEFQKKGYRPDPSNASAVSIETTSEKVNSTDPVQILLPFYPRGNNPSRDKNGKNKAKKPSSELKGILIATVAGDKNNKTLLGAIGSVIDNSGNEPTVQTIGNVSSSNREAGVIHETPREEVQFRTSQSIGCATCSIILGNICAAVTGKITEAVCSRAGVACGVGGGGVNIPAAIGCAAACSLVVGSVGAFACFYGVGEACERGGFC